jgi:hypothetical protein
VTYGNGVFVAVAYNGRNRVMTSNCSASVAVPGGTAMVTASAGACFSPTSSAVPISPAPPAGLAFPYGLIGFSISGVTAGGSTTVTVTLPGPVTEYWKLQNNTWHQVTGATFAGNQVRRVLEVELR